MKRINLCLLGFGNVGQAFVRLIDRKAALIKVVHSLDFRVTAIATAHHGRAIDRDGINVRKAVRLVQGGKSIDALSRKPAPGSNPEFIEASSAHVLLENTPVNFHTGQPAVDHIRTALACGMHAITANKGAVVFSHRELTALAKKNDLSFLFESAVMDGAPIFSLFRESLPVIELKGFYGILNSCTNFILELMEQGMSLEQAIEAGRKIGITETDPSADIDGWDAAIKICALSTVLLGVPITPTQVKRQGIRKIGQEQLSRARQQNKKWKLVCRAERKGKRVNASVAPELVDSGSPLYAVMGTSSFIQFQTDTLPGLGILESDPGPETTAFGLLADLLYALK